MTNPAKRHITIKTNKNSFEGSINLKASHKKTAQQIKPAAEDPIYLFKNQDNKEKGNFLPIITSEYSQYGSPPRVQFQ